MEDVSSFVLKGEKWNEEDDCCIEEALGFHQQKILKIERFLQLSNIVQFCHHCVNIDFWIVHSLQVILWSITRY